VPTLDDLPTPALLVDLDRLEANLSRMQERCDRLGVALRPHVKTHKCVEIGRMQQELGAHGFTVSTLAEARAFADAGFSDLTWAFPAVPSRLGEAVALARQVTLRLTVDGPEAAARVETAAREAGLRLHVFLEIDCGDHRSGVDATTAEGAERALGLAHAIAASPHLAFDGLLTHAGHAYAAGSRTEAAAVAEQERSVAAALAGRLRAAGVEVPTVSVGSTPGMTALSEPGDLAGVTEARPGNYAYFDATQVAIGSCAVRDCALTVLATVVSSQPGAGHAVIDAGALALSKDTGPAGEVDGAPAGMGRIYRDHAAGVLDPELRVTSVSQEHGVLSAPLRHLPHGTRVRILPNHSCLTNACFDAVHAVRGNEVVDTWKVHRGR
jgi:D-serine deaminase-like pyridoxal phosphate-dependent protein